MVCVFSFKGTDKKKKTTDHQKILAKLVLLLTEHIGLKYISLVNLSRVFGLKMRTDQTYGKLNHTNILQIYIVKCAYNDSKLVQAN